MDVHDARLGLLRKAAALQGLGGLVSTRCTSLQAFAAERSGMAQASGFDRVLVDAPCSGTGVLSKRPDLRWRRTAADLQELVPLQVASLSLSLSLYLSLSLSHARFMCLITHVLQELARMHQ